MYIYIFIYTHMYMYILIHVWLKSRYTPNVLSMCRYTLLYQEQIYFIYVYIHTCIYIFICIYICVGIYVYLYMYLFMYIYTYVYMYIHMYIRIHHMAGAYLRLNDAVNMTYYVFLTLNSCTRYIHVCVCVCVCEWYTKIHTN